MVRINNDEKKKPCRCTAKSVGKLWRSCHARMHARTLAHTHPQPRATSSVCSNLCHRSADRSVTPCNPLQINRSRHYPAARSFYPDPLGSSLHTNDRKHNTPCWFPLSVSFCPRTVEMNLKSGCLPYALKSIVCFPVFCVNCVQGCKILSQSILLWCAYVFIFSLFIDPHQTGCVSGSGK